jgi:hypothetical protein
LWHSRDAHAGVPFSDKHVWRAGYDEAKRAVLGEINDPLPAVVRDPSQGGLS